MASRRSPSSAEIGRIATDAEQQELMAMEVDETSLEFALLCSYFFFPKSGRSGLLSILPYLDDLHEMKSANWAVAIHEYLISGVQQCQEHVKVNVRDDRPNVSRRLTASTSTTSRTPPSDKHVLGILQELLRVSKEQREVIELQTDLL
ncbi:hypothetical protein Taro_034609, partial [Colocasia esculenta]|nr:hypothetical protein [Colocasia esculenta]